MNTEITDYQIDIIIGSMLGDGCLTCVGRHRRKNSCFAEVHSVKQYELLDWKRQMLMPLSKSITSKFVDGRKIVNNKVVTDKSKKLESCRLETIVHPTLTELESKWYKRDANGQYVLHNKKRIKIVPNDLVLNKNIIAVWYFDDGSNNPKNRQIAFNTQSFEKDTIDILADKLRKFGIDCGVYKNRNQHIIQVMAKSYLNMIDLIKDKLPCECMSYKIDLSKYKAPNYSTRFQSKKTPSELIH